MRGLTERQAEAALHHDQSLCVIAGAGTGKTHLLVQKYLDLIEQKNVGVSEILALTFTDKAAAEMKERIRRAVMKKEGWDAVQDDLLSANISTFHSFCSQVLREFPIESGIRPGFTVLDDLALRMIRNDAIRQLLYTECEESPVVPVLRAIGSRDLASCLDILYEEREHAEIFFRTLEMDEEMILTIWEDTVSAFVSEAVDDLLKDPPFITALSTLRVLADRYPGTSDRAMEYLREVGQAIPDLHECSSLDARLSSIRDLIRIHTDYRANMGSKKNWDGDDLDTLKEGFKVVRALLKEKHEILTLSFSPDDSFTRRTIAFLRDLGSVFGDYTRMIDAAKGRQNGLDYNDLIRITHQLFTRNDDLVEEHFRRRYRYILVDEYQDTDPAQSDIIRMIIGDIQQPTERLFVVGDPKQSIYLFRRADVTQFASTRDLICRHFSGREIALDRNFRSTPEVMGFVNLLFSSLMKDAGKAWEFPYQMLQPERAGETGSVTLLLSDGEGDADTMVRGEAEMVARYIQSAVVGERIPLVQTPDGAHPDMTRPAGYGDFAILVERRKNIPVFDRALRKYGIPLHIHSGSGFYTQQEVLDLHLILSFLENEGDSLALFGALRSPFFGLSDGTLFHINEAGPKWKSLWRCLEVYSGEHPQSDASMAFDRLLSWRSSANRIEPASLIRKIIEDSGIYAVYSGIEGGDQAIANMEKLLSIARNDGRSLSHFVELMRLSISGESDAGEASVDLSSENSVSIMTVHASKGLEFPVVVLPELTRRINGTPKKIRVEDGLLLGVKIPDPDDAFTPRATPILIIQNERYRQKEAAERRRLLYVATTRARDHLILSGSRPGSPPEALSACKSRMDWISHILGITDEAIAEGSLEITPPCGCTPIRMTIISDPATFEAEPVVREPVLRTLPDDLISEGEPVLPLPFLPAEPLLSPSRIEALRSYDPISERFRLKKRLGPKREDARMRGSILHEVFQGKDVASVLRRYGSENPEQAGLLSDLYERFLASEMMQGCLEDHCEVPFRSRVHGILFRGTIDRLVRRSDQRWIVIDYKTGAVSDPEIPGLINEYLVQMAVYRHAAEAILRQPVTPYIYLPETDSFVEVMIDEGEVASRIHEAVEKFDGDR
ncbi:hypothetical protein RJ53_02680 [Methanocalculus chunghsingensis]|uniref:DNA 3'-5' helicase n=1 Tax=Methanocalculus chunghsingensis TaxID=156457 RepID=A0A8J7W696_9EURY|nr:UvrD-helicase domain-containing protein [Methanocalculus chunghsingensis]MBR1368466.1 hypothetical protein [Methanocalculus chunghsingensis]